MAHGKSSLATRQTWIQITSSAVVLEGLAGVYSPIMSAEKRNEGGRGGRDRGGVDRNGIVDNTGKKDAVVDAGRGWKGKSKKNKSRSNGLDNNSNNNNIHSGARPIMGNNNRGRRGYSNARPQQNPRSNQNYPGDWGGGYSPDGSYEDHDHMLELEDVRTFIHPTPFLLLFPIVSTGIFSLSWTHY